MDDVRFPSPLRPSARIAITAPSSGVSARCHRRLDRVLSTVRRLGYEVVEGRCLREEHAEESAPAAERAQELMDFLTRPDIDAVFPPWGGERALEVLPLLDFDRLRAAAPRWVVGYSDISTLLVPLLLRAGWASAHGPQLMDQSPVETDRLTTDVWRLLGRGLDEPFVQRSSTLHVGRRSDFAVDPDATFSLDRPTRWKQLATRAPRAERFEGRLIGGCLEVMTALAGTPYGNVGTFVERQRAEGVVLFLENVGLAPAGVLRGLLQLRYAGWMNGVRAVVLGRSAYAKPPEPGDLTYEEALEAALSDLDVFVIGDADIGHVPPQLTLVEGAFASFVREGNDWLVSQRC